MYTTTRLELDGVTMELTPARTSGVEIKLVQGLTKRTIVFVLSGKQIPQLIPILEGYIPDTLKVTNKDPHSIGPFR